MKVKHLSFALLLALAAGCDTMDQDVDGKTLSINNDPAYFLPNSDGYIDLPSRILAPGQIRVEITGSTKNGVLKDLGRGLLQYSPNKGSSNDSFRFRVFSNDNNVIAEDSIGIIIPSDTTTLPCKYVYTRNDSVHNVTGPVTINVIANDYSCSGTLSVFVNAPEHGTATVIGDQVRYTPGPSFEGTDQFLYKAVSSDASLIAGYAMVRIVGGDSTTCTSVANNDLFYKPLNDSSLAYFKVLSNDVVCSDSSIKITLNPHYGIAFVDNNLRRIGYRNPLSANHDDTLFYKVGSSNIARVIIKRQ
jgi:hypothetical protein